jgi:hypothetical protein
MCSAYAPPTQGDIAVNRYYIDGCLAVFDTPGEWTYDGDHLVVRLPTGASPLATNDETRIRGKDQTCTPPLPFREHAAQICHHCCCCR